MLHPLKLASSAGLKTCWVERLRLSFSLRLCLSRPSMVSLQNRNSQMLAAVMVRASHALKVVGTAEVKVVVRDVATGVAGVESRIELSARLALTARCRASRASGWSLTVQACRWVPIRE